MDVFSNDYARPRAFAPQVLRRHAVLALLLALAGLSLPAAAQTAARCDSLYAVARAARVEVGNGIGQARFSEAERRQWRQTVQRLLQASKRIRVCYEALLPSADTTRAAPASSPEAAPLPMPNALAHQRVQVSYEWAALAYRVLQKYDMAFQQLDTFFHRFASSADSSMLAYMYNLRGYQHYVLGNLTEAINDYSRTIAYTPTADTLDRADLMIDLGTILQKIKDLSTARTYYARAERLAQSASVSDYQRETLGRALFNQGDVLKLKWSGDTEDARTTRLRQATDLLQQAIDLYPDARNDRLALTHIALGDTYRLLGDLESARRQVERGRSIAVAYDSVRSSQANVLALAGRVRGLIEFAADNPEAAIASFTEALRFVEMGPDRTRRYSLLNDLGEVHEYRGDLARAETYYRQAIALSNELRTSLRATEWAAFASGDWAAPRRGLTRVLMAQDRPREAFLVLDRSRARHLRDQQLQIRLTSTLPPRQRVRFDSLTAALSEVRSTLATDALPADRQAALEQKEVHLMAARRALLDIAPAPTLPSIAALQRTLKAQQRALVAYYIDDTSLTDEPASQAFVVTPNAFYAVPLSLHADSLQARLAAVSPVLSTDDTVALSIEAVNFDLDALHRLYTDLFAPVAELLPPELPLTILPDGPLFRLPFGMLVTEPTERFAHARAPYLIRERPLSMDLSAALLLEEDPTADRAFSLDIAALGRTRFDAVPTLPPALRSRLDSTGALPSLPGVEHEIEAVRERFARHETALDDQATEGRLRTLQSRAQILHLASHALIHPSDPLANLFVLSPDGSSDRPEDGLLFVHELNPAPVPLVVLSGCRTARGLIRTGEGPEGLQYAFRSTGAQSTLATLWDADDQAIGALTAAFYDHLIDGHPKDVALQRAQLDMLAQFPDRASPFFWASTVLYGTPRPLTLEPAPPIPLLPIAAGGAILLLVALGVGYSRYRRH